MKCVLIFIFTLCIHFSVSANGPSTRGLLELLDKRTEVVTQGDAQVFMITIWPLEYSQGKELELALRKNKLVEGLKLINILGSDISPNNKDAYVLTFDAVVLSPEISNIIRINEREIVLEQRGFSIAPYEMISDKPLVLNTAESSWPKKQIILLILGLLIVIIGIILFVKKVMRTKKLERKYNEEKGFWRNKLETASTREDFEEVYRSRATWVKFTQLGQSALDEFSLQMENIQYKKSWSDEELQNIKEIYRKLKGTF